MLLLVNERGDEETFAEAVEGAVPSSFVHETKVTKMKIAISCFTILKLILN